MIEVEDFIKFENVVRNYIKKHFIDNVCFDETENNMELCQNADIQKNLCENLEFDNDDEYFSENTNDNVANQENDDEILVREGLGELFVHSSEEDIL